ncbi:hypothetical protein GCM10027203_17580 [Nonomuraea fastidiosa]
MSLQPLKRAAVALLEQIAAHDRGDGVLFQPAPRGCRRLDGGAFATRDETFRVPSMLGFITVEHPRLGVWRVRITQAGRDYLTQVEARRAKHGRKARDDEAAR